MQLIALKFLGPLGTKIAGTLALGGVAAIGAEVADRTGLVDRATGALLHLAGLPDRPKHHRVPELPPAQVPEAVRVGDPVRVGESAAALTYCPICATGPSTSGIGEALEVKPHTSCVAGLEKSAAGLPLIYIGWAKSVSFDPKDPRAPMPTIEDAGMRTAAGLPDVARLARSLADWQVYAAGLGGVDVGSVSSDCGPYPTINTPGMRDAFGIPSYGILSAAQAKWNECAERSRSAQQKVDAAKAEVKALKDTAATKAQKMAAGWALSRQTKKYTDQIADLQKQQADAANASRQAEIQKQIDTITAQKDQAVQLAEQLKAAQSASASDAMKAQIADLTREIAEKGRTSGGMDQYMQMLLLQRLAAPPAAAPAAPWVDPSQVAPVYQQPAYAPPQQVVVIDPSAGYGGDFDDGFSLMGADESAPMDPDTARELGIAGAETIGDAAMLLDYRDAFGDEAEDLITEISGCMLGSCGLGSSMKQD